MTLGEVQKILQQLLREQVSIRDLGTILETLVEAAAVNKNPIALVEAARQALSRALVRPLLDDQGRLLLFTIDGAIEEECNRAVSGQAAPGNAHALQLTVSRRILEGMKKILGEQAGMAPPVLLCSSPGRFYLRRLLEPVLPKIVVLSPPEIPPAVQVQALGVLR
jgi:flagellar biosynthesis protein FlhA